MMRHIRLTFALIGSVLLCGCTLAQAAPTAFPTATTVEVSAAVSPIPTLKRLLPTETPDAEVTPEVTAESHAHTADETPSGVSPHRVGVVICDMDADVPATQHVVEATINYAEKRAAVRQIVQHVNRGDEPYSDLVFNVEPNYWLETFALESVTGGGNTTLTGRRLQIQLSQPLEKNCAVTVEIVFTLNIPRIGEGILGYKGFFGYSERQINLGHWLPTLALRSNKNWITREVYTNGEQNVLDIADWDVTWTLEDAEDVTAAAPGEIETLDEGKTRAVLKRAREYSMSLSDRFVKLHDVSITGVPVALYTLGSTEVTTPNGRVVDGAPHALTMALRSLELFTDKFGPYIYPSMIVVEGDFPDGMEFSGFAFVSETWFRQYDGTPNGYLTLITVHEVAHQWWYARVGSDSAMAPWLDEALSTYSELLFMEQFYLNSTPWWWEFRVNAYSPTGFVDSNIYQFSNIRSYINAVYLNGVRMLHQLRMDLGDAAFFGLLRSYVETYDGLQVGDSRSFWALLSPEQLAATRTTRMQFLRQPDF